MLSRSTTARRTITSLLRHASPTSLLRPGLGKMRQYAEARTEIASDVNPDISAAGVDVGMNGHYVNPPYEKRQFRDPYGNWWDKQEKRNFGEPAHEDEDMMGVFTPHVYTHSTPGKAFFQLGCFIAAVFGLCGVVYVAYPDKPAVPRTFLDGGLDRALGGKGAQLARSDADD